MRNFITISGLTTGLIGSCQTRNVVNVTVARSLRMYDLARFLFDRLARRVMVSRLALRVRSGQRHGLRPLPAWLKLTHACMPGRQDRSAAVGIF